MAVGSCSGLAGVPTNLSVAVLSVCALAACRSNRNWEIFCSNAFFGISVEAKHMECAECDWKNENGLDICYGK